MVLRITLRFVSTAPSNVDRPHHLGRLRGPLPVHAQLQLRIFARALRLSPARLRLSTVRIWLPQLAHGRHARTQPGRRRRLVLVRLHRRAPHARLAPSQLHGSLYRPVCHTVDLTLPRHRRAAWWRCSDSANTPATSALRQKVRIPPRPCSPVSPSPGASPRLRGPHHQHRAALQLMWYAGQFDHSADGRRR